MIPAARPAQYAAAFLAALREVPAPQHPALVDGFLRVLVQDRQLPHWPQVQQELERQAVARWGRVARPEDRTAVASALGEGVTVTRDPTLIAGAVLRIGDTLVDGSLAGQLRRLVQFLRAA